jgi:hypothetical protein
MTTPITMLRMKNTSLHLLTWLMATLMTILRIKKTPSTTNTKKYRAIHTLALKRGCEYRLVQSMA